jgi:hypothetical protein
LVDVSVISISTILCILVFYFVREQSFTFMFLLVILNFIGFIIF